MGVCVLCTLGSTQCFGCKSMIIIMTLVLWLPFRYYYYQFSCMQWSFGVTCWEVFTLGKNPYPGVHPFSVIRYLEEGERLDKPLNEACSQEK